MNLPTRITEWKIPCVYSCLSNNKKIEDQVCITFYVTLIIENIFGLLSNSKLKGYAHGLFGERRVRNLEMFLLRKR